MVASSRDEGTWMKTTAHNINHQHWDLSRWFAILSPFIGIALGLLGLIVFAQ
jgi:hypothetical protein